MDNLELVSFQIISAVGVAKSSYIWSNEIAEKGDFDFKLKQKLKEGNQEFVKGHEAHAGLIQKEANGEKSCTKYFIDACRRSTYVCWNN